MYVVSWYLPIGSRPFHGKVAFWTPWTGHQRCCHVAAASLLALDIAIGANLFQVGSREYVIETHKTILSDDSLWFINAH
jgi:hypothetical protein